MAERNIRTMVYPRGGRIVCAECGSHVATLAIDLFYGDRLSASHFNNEGQGPWGLGEEMRCRECGALWFQHGQLFQFAPNETTINILRGDYEAVQDQSSFQQARAIRQATVIATIMDMFYNRAITEGLTDFEEQIYAVLRGNQSSEIELFKKEFERLQGRTN